MEQPPAMFLAFAPPPPPPQAAAAALEEAAGAFPEVDPFLVEALENPRHRLTGDTDDFWGADGDLADDLNDGFNIGESKSRHRQMHSIGYLDGITAGKQASAQEGFNTGFNQSVHVGYKLGLARGISSTLASLPDQLKEQLLGTPENEDRLQSLQQSLKARSSNDAQVIFYDGIRQDATSQPDHLSEVNWQNVVACKQLEFLFKELKLLTSEVPDIKVNFEFGRRRIE